MAHLLLLLLFAPIAASSRSFLAMDPSTALLGLSDPCSSLIVTVLGGGVSTSACALACAADSLCRAFLLSPGADCRLLSAPCVAKGVWVDARVLDHPSSLSWRYNGSRYAVTQSASDFEGARRLCGQMGMRLWHPRTQEENALVDSQIRALPASPYHNFDRHMFAKVWLGIKDLSGSGCVLQDGTTPCPMTDYYPNEPNGDNEECVQPSWNNDTGEKGWNDIPCDRSMYGLCVGEYE